MDNATFSNMKCKSSVWNNDTTVKRVLCKMSGRGRSGNHGKGGRVMVEAEVQGDPHINEETAMAVMTMMTEQRKWSSCPIVQE